VDLGVPAPVITTALFERFNSRNLGTFASKVLNGMRYMFVRTSCKMKFLFHIVEYLAQSPVWIGLCGFVLIIPPIIGMMYVHSNVKKDGHQPSKSRK